MSPKNNSDPLKDYDDSQRANRVLRDYSLDIMALGIQRVAYNLVKSCNKADDLEIKLDSLVTLTRQRKIWEKTNSMRKLER
ncbi:MAG: hypothetical protein AABX23_01090 [Nanoarchaeota archaeon]